jgi:hypothetical protein
VCKGERVVPLEVLAWQISSSRAEEMIELRCLPVKLLGFASTWKINLARKWWNLHGKRARCSAVSSADSQWLGRSAVQLGEWVFGLHPICGRRSTSGQSPVALRCAPGISVFYPGRRKHDSRSLLISRFSRCSPIRNGWRVGTMWRDGLGPREESSGRKHI